MVTEDLNFINKIKTRALAKKHLKEMKKIEIWNPFLSDVQTYSGVWMRDYQLVQASKILNDFKRTYTDLNFKADVFEYFRIFQMGTGDGKSFSIPFILEHATKFHIEYMEETKGTILILAPRNQLLDVFIDDLEKHLVKGLNDDGITTRLYSSVGKGRDLKSFKKDAPIIKIVVLTDQKSLSNSFDLNIPDLFFAIRDEGMGLDSESKEKAAKVDGIPNAQLKWHDNFKKLPCFKLLLNATPSISQEKAFDAKEMHIYRDNSPKKWIKPIAMDPIIRNIDIKDYEGKVNLLKEGIDDFIHFSLNYNYNKEYAKENGIRLSESAKGFKPVTLVKATIDRLDYHLPVEEVKDIVTQLDKKYSKEEREFEVYNKFTNETVKVPYTEGTLNPVICDQKNPYDVVDLTEEWEPDNVLIVCDMGTFGINVPNLTHLIFLRPSERHEGRIGAVKQLFGRMERNWTQDDYNLAQMLVDTESRSFAEFNFNLDMSLDTITKRIYLPTTDNNVEAAKCWQDNLCDYDTKKEDIKKILNDNKYMVPFSSVKDSGGVSQSYTYEDVRTKECSNPEFQNPLFDLYINAYKLKGCSDFDANHFALADAMQNAHVLDKTGEVRCLCQICHGVETRLGKHYLPMGHKDRTA